MSAEATRGRKKVDPNETTGQKLARLANGRVTSILDRLDKVGNLGPVVHEYAKENEVDPAVIVNQILKPIIDKFNAMKQSLETGKPTSTGFSLKLGS